MAAFEVIALDTATPQLRAPGASDTYTFPRQALFLAGTTAAPGIAQTSDDNTGMWWPAADTLAWSLGSTEQMRLTSTGLGIGTTSPWSQLTVGSGGTANPAATVSFHASTVNEYRLKLTSTLFNSDTSWLGLGFGYSDNYMKAAIIAEAKDANARANLHFALNDVVSSANAGLSDSKMVLTYTGNLGLGTSSFGTSAAGVLSIGNGTEPSTGPANTVQVYSVDLSAGNTIPAVYCEGSGVTNAGITNVTVTHKIAIKVNGTVYYLLATTNAT